MTINNNYTFGGDNNAPIAGRDIKNSGVMVTNLNTQSEAMLAEVIALRMTVSEAGQAAVDEVASQLKEAIAAPNEAEKVGLLRKTLNFMNDCTTVAAFTELAAKWTPIFAGLGMTL